MQRMKYPDSGVPVAGGRPSFQLYIGSKRHVGAARSMPAFKVKNPWIPGEVRLGAQGQAPVPCSKKKTNSFRLIVNERD